MKLLFLSDTHLGFGRKNREYPERREDAAKGFEAALDIGKKEGVDVFIHAGDMFDSPRPGIEVLNTTVKGLVSLPEGKYSIKVEELVNEKTREFEVNRVPFVVIHGNHDRVQEAERSVLTFLERAGLVINAHRRKVVIKGENGSVCIVGMGWIPDTYVSDVLKSYKVECDCDVNVFVFHQPVKGLYPFNTREKPVDPSLFPDNFDVYVGGHLHWVVDRKIYTKRFLLPGSTVITKLKDSEMIEPRSVFVWEKDVRRIQLPVRRGYIVKAATDNIISAIEDVLERHVGPPPLVKVILEGKREGDIDEEAVRKLFSGKALIYIFDKREDEFFRRLREIKADLKGDVFAREAVLSLLKEKLGFWDQDVERLVEAALDGDEERAVGVIRGEREIIEWFG